ncbi:GNAT family N-acetyltransferase [uncultured Oscillibacter sp.]|uniref:GNAT family N-acetyltransferase n=2 Tax=uncultured Oscillibacter sp. TaxID=876091 RepID=UPI0025EC9FDF|nr:GNAT family N-acetyltransferase [uncultured Oscillibacter sp.]
MREAAGRMALTFRYAEEADTPLILQFIRELADYEHLLDQVVADEAILAEQLFERKNAEVLFALEDGREVGFTLFFHNFSTFLGRSGLYLEDLYVRPACRGKGYGRALLQKLASIAQERGCGRMEWWCLDWNAPSIAFYKSLGAEPMEDWTVYRLSGDTLRRLAES